MHKGQWQGEWGPRGGQTGAVRVGEERGEGHAALEYHSIPRGNRLPGLFADPGPGQPGACAMRVLCLTLALLVGI